MFYYFLLEVTKVKDFIILSFLVQTPYLGKFYLTSYIPKCSHPIRFQGSLIISVSGRKGLIYLFFYMEIFSKDRQRLRLLLLVGCIQACPVTPSSPQIYSTSALSSCGGMTRSKLIQNERSINALETQMFFSQFNAENFKLLNKMCSHSVRLQNFLIINVSGRKQSMSYIFGQRESDRGIIGIASKTTTVGLVWLCVPSHAQCCLGVSGVNLVCLGVACPHKINSEWKIN